MTWTDPQVERLRALHAEGLSFSQIAVEINHEFKTRYTRNAMIGKALRIGLPTRDKAESARKGWDKPRKPRQPSRRVLKMIEPESEPAGPTDLPPDRSDCAVQLLNLQDHHCRWPLGEPRDGMFCGVPKLGEYPYCRRHYRLAYTRQAPETPAARELRQREMHRRGVA